MSSVTLTVKSAVASVRGNMLKVAGSADLIRRLVHEFTIIIRHRCKERV